MMNFKRDPWRVHPGSLAMAVGRLVAEKRLATQAIQSRVGSMEESAGRDLSAEEVGDLPETRMLPDGARILSKNATGTYDGARYDNFDPGATYDCFFVCLGQFHDAVGWFSQMLGTLGWPTGTDIADGSLPWHVWTRGRERINLIDFTKSAWTRFPVPPAGWSMLRLDYSRKPARDFASDDEYQEWFKDTEGKGERWRRRATDK